MRRVAILLFSLNAFFLSVFGNPLDTKIIRRRRPGFPGSGPNGFKLTGCDVSTKTLTLPASAAAVNMSIPANQTPAFVALGRGVQNYTCSGGVYGTNMAVATLFDASCAVGTPFYDTLPQLALKEKLGSQLPGPCQNIIGTLKLGDHYFQKLSPTAANANPVFDFRATGKGDYIAASKFAAVPSPTNSSANVAWVELKNVQGTLAQTIFRVSTAGGVPPSSCSTDGQVITVDYAAYYWMYK